MVRQTVRYNLLLHLTVLIFGFTAILGRLIQLDAHILVWYRLVIAISGVAAYMVWRRQPLTATPRGVLTLCTAGLLIGAHWVLFFAAIKVSNVSITLVCLSVSPLLVALFEPLVFKRSIRPYEVAFGILVVTGLWFIFRFESRHTLGMVLALSAAALASILAVVNARLILKYNSSIITLYELMGGFTGLTLYILAAGADTDNLVPGIADVVYLLILGIVCTTFAYIAFVEVMKVLSPYTAMLCVNLEPVYGIILALIIFGDSEYMTPGFYAGAGLILVTILADGLLKRRESIGAADP